MSTTWKIDPKTFLDRFTGKHLFCTGGNTGMKITPVLKSALEANSVHDAYFFINEGGSKQGDIKTLRAFFVDIDAGRDSKKKYFKPSVVATKKKAMLKTLTTFSPKPNIIVETRNGYQAYWIFSKPVRATAEAVATWNRVQTTLANVFGADPLAKKINQVYRLPGTWWRKPWEGKKDTFLTRWRDCSTTQYVFRELVNTISKGWEGCKPITKPKSASFPRTEPAGFTTNMDVQGCDVKEFLKDVAQMLYFKKLYFMSKLAWTLYSSFDENYTPRKTKKCSRQF